MTINHIEGIVEEVLNGNSDLFHGFADLSGKLSSAFNKHHYAIVIGRKLDNNIIDGIKSGPNMVYWDHYNEVNSQLYELISLLSEKLSLVDIPTRVIKPTLTDKIIDTNYDETLRVEFSHKMAATQAGLGWIGKTALFVSKEFGTRVRLVTLLTTHPLEPTGIPFKESKCGKCNICVEKCPAGAATGELWHTELDRDAFFDAFKCRAMCRKLGHKSIGMGKRLCGICVSVCPIGRKKI